MLGEEIEVETMEGTIGIGEGEIEIVGIDTADIGLEGSGIGGATIESTLHNPVNVGPSQGAKNPPHGDADVRTRFPSLNHSILNQRMPGVVPNPQPACRLDVGTGA